MKKKIIFFIFFVFSLWIWKDLKKIDTSYLNQSNITYDYGNLNNKYLKYLFTKYNNFLENFYTKNIEDHKDYWTLESQESRDKLPSSKTISPAINITKNTHEIISNKDNWFRSHGNNHSNRYSKLKLINNKNSQNLELAWTFEMTGEKGDIQANPIFFDGKIYTPIAGGYIVALDGKTGKLIWKSEKLGSFAAKRGLVYWEGNKIEKPRIIFSNRERLISLDAKDGKFIKSFGKNGKVRSGLNVMTPVIYKDNIVIVTWEKAIEVYDLVSGKIKWKLKYQKKNKNRVGGVKYNNSGSNPWGGISADINRGILYFTTGNPHYYFDGSRRPGKNRMSNSIIAVDLNKRKIIWDFQETAHDIWNSDLPAPPIITSIKKEGELIDIVITPTKRSNTLILDRISGKPIFDYKLSKAPVSKIVGEKTHPYQPDLEIPEPFGKNKFNFNDIWSYDPVQLEKLKENYKDHKFGFYETYEIGKKNLQYSFNGGAEWMGGSVNPESQIFYVTSNNIPWIAELERINDKKILIPIYKSKFKRALDDSGYPITKPPWGTLTALNLNNGKIIWQVPFGEYENLKKMGIKKTGTENFGGVTSTAGQILIATGTLDKKLFIYNSDNGKILYEYKMPYVGSSPPTTYLYKNEQYIIVHASGGRTLKKGYPQLINDGNLILAFKLK